ncbi:MAG: hypothetical protein ACFFD9_04220 [Candidatus Thorarchaeota archaeon]
MAFISEMIKRYTELSEAPDDKLSFNENGESLSVLCQSEWVRILVIRHLNAPDQVTIEVELSFPTRVGSAKAETLEDADSDANATSNTLSLLKEAVEHLHYLSKLHDKGFALDVIGQECLWTAFRDFNSTPDTEMFELLNPPSDCSPLDDESLVIPPFRYTI